MSSFIVSRTCNNDQGDAGVEMSGVYRRNGRENHMSVHFVHVRGKTH
jgi:hypothetical protein